MKVKILEAGLWIRDTHVDRVEDVETLEVGYLCHDGEAGSWGEEGEVIEIPAGWHIVSEEDLE